MRFGSLFAGIGGIDLGLERAGMTCEWQVEIDSFCLKVLAKHWPEVTRYEDIREVGSDNLTPVDLICGGFPCQPHSLAGKREASEDERDLWGEMFRVVCEVKPRWMLAENVPGLLSSEAGRFFGRVLGDLASVGYDVEWESLPAAAFGAPHRRDRIFIVADAERIRRTKMDFVFQRNAISRSNSGTWNGRRMDQSDIERVVDGIPNQMDRLRSLGNAVVPQVAEWIGRRIVETQRKETLVAKERHDEG